MKLYHWYSKVLSAYSDGDIVVMAESVEQARDKVWSQFDPLKEDNPFEDYYLQSLRYIGDEDYMTEYLKKQNALREDLNKEPMQLISDVICIRGSD
jgi:CobQ-like glutamine amidotransferase family enzyme